MISILCTRCQLHRSSKLDCASDIRFALHFRLRSTGQSSAAANIYLVYYSVSCNIGHDADNMSKHKYLRLRDSTVNDTYRHTLGLQISVAFGNHQ